MKTITFNFEQIKQFINDISDNEYRLSNEGKIQYSSYSYRTDTLSWNDYKADNNEKLKGLIKDKKAIQIQDLSDNTIEQIILDYMERHHSIEKEVYPSNIAFNFNLDTKKVFEICKKLKKEEKLS